jgi:molecular chaperone DnaK (HSP70)
MSIYDSLIKGIEKTKSSSLGIADYLKSLQPTMRELRKSYFNKPVYVPYHREDIQSAYLIAYLPHYYNLIYSILLNEGEEIFGEKEEINIGFIGGGPGSEVYGAIKYILNNRPIIKRVNIVLFDINSETWNYSHKIVKDFLIGEIEGSENITLTWTAKKFDLTSSGDVSISQSIFKKLHLLVVQNCLNEIASDQFDQLKVNIESIFNGLPGKSFFLMSDLTSGARDVIKKLESTLENTGLIRYKNTTLNQSYPLKTRSINPAPSLLIKTNLLIGSDGLIPRVNLTYDYSLLSKEHISAKRELIEEAGFMALYNPLAHNQIDVNNYVHTKTFVGIDFGTSNTVISYAVIENEELKVETIPIIQKDIYGYETESRMLPSVMALMNNRLLVGKHAAELKVTLEKGKNCWYGFKENLKTINSERYPESVLKEHSALRIMNAKDALKIYFGYIKSGIEKYIERENLSEQIAYSISVPAGFSSIEKKELLDCMISAGLEVGESPLIDEPNAALINYLFEENNILNTDTDKNILIIDLGAGTVDVSVMRIKKGFEGIKSELLSVKRDGFVGGNLLDQLLAIELLKGRSNFESLEELKKNELLAVCEKLKVVVCSNIKTDKSVNYELPPRSFSEEIVLLPVGENLNKIGLTNVSLSYLTFSKLIDTYWYVLLKTIISATDESINNLYELDSVILTGGGGRNPYLKAKIASCFSNSNLIIPDNIQEHVARGTALQSFVFNCYGKNIITPITTHEVYIETEKGRSIVFESGMVIPSIDKEIIVENQFPEVRQIKFVFGEEVFKFRIDTRLFIEKIIVFFNQNQELECEIVTKENVIELQQIFDNLNDKLITIKLD